MINMNSIDLFEQEKRLNHGLILIYKEYWSRMSSALTTLNEEELSGLSNPYLIKALPAYRKAKKKVLFVGQETNGWESIKETFERYTNREYPYHQEEVIEYLQWMYEDFRFQRKSDHTPFWRVLRSFNQAITGEVDNDAFLNTQLVRFDLNCSRPPYGIEDLLQEEFNVLPYEVEVLEPNVVVFLTGPNYDSRIEKTFTKRHGTETNLKFMEVSGYTIRQFARLEHPTLPFHTYRTYHPKYLLLSDIDLFHRIEETFKEINIHKNN